jgi:hypothetical protein
MPLKKDVIFPIFLECCQYANGDIFWENVFEDLAYGRAPYGAYISKNFLSCNYKKKEFNYPIEKKDPKVIHTEVYALLSKKLGILSQRDKVNLEKNFSQAETDLKETRKNWAKIRKKNMRELLIELFVIRMKNEFVLTNDQSRDLLSFIFMALTLKVISSDDINYENGQILAIDGISFSEGKVVYDRDLNTVDLDIEPSDACQNEVNVNKDTGTEKKEMSDNWVKFIEKLDKAQKFPRGNNTNGNGNVVENDES